MKYIHLNKRIRFFSMLSFLLCFALLFTACPTGDDIGGDDTGGYDEDSLTFKDGVYTLSFTVPNEQVRYLNLSTAEWVTDPELIGSPDWDIAFHASRLIYTNSGATAADLSSGGYGGVWFTNTTNFDAVNSEADKATEDSDNPDFDYEPYNQDLKRYVMVMGSRYHRRLNVMTYAGYPYEDSAYGGVIYDGSADNKALAGHDSLVNYNYDKKQYYWNPPMPDGSLRMPPDFEATGQVYIIRHGNSAEFSKIQISRFYRDFGTNSDSYTLQWKKFED